MDIDFLVSDATGYRGLRELLTGPAGLAPITRAGAPALVVTREVRADQYGIRTQVQMHGQAIKLLANSDRQADDGVFSRDVIDLAKALDRLQSREGWLDRCRAKPPQPLALSRLVSAKLAA